MTEVKRTRKPKKEIIETNVNGNQINEIIVDDLDNTTNIELPTDILKDTKVNISPNVDYKHYNEVVHSGTTMLRTYLDNVPNEINEIADKPFTLCVYSKNPVVWQLLTNNKTYDLRYGDSLYIKENQEYNIIKGVNELILRIIYPCQSK